MTTPNHNELLIRIDERVRVILEEVSSLKIELQIQNGRIRALEKWRWRLSGAISLLALIIVAIGGRIIFF